MIAPRVAMIQDAARLHYAIPLAMQRAGILERMFTDFYVKAGSPMALAAKVAGAVRPAFGRKMLGRRCEELDDRLIFHNPRLALRMYRARPRGHANAEYAIDTGRWFGDWMRRVGLGSANALMGFIRDFDPVFVAECTRAGLATVGDQMSAPISESMRVARHLKQQWPEWDPTWSVDDLQRFEPLQTQSWDAVGHFTCASEYVRDGMIADGIDRTRISVLPYPIDARSFPPVQRDRRSGPLTVGCVQRVTLPKGAPYLFEVARRFDPKDVRFVVVGQIGLPASIVSAHKGNVELIGPVPRSAVFGWLEKFDVFFFPATCEGSAGSVIEAMASGLPVVTTPNSGTFAREGVEGFIRAYDDVDGMAEAVGRLAGDRELRLKMGAAARQRVCTFDIDHYAREIGDLFRRLLNPL